MEGGRSLFPPLIQLHRMCRQRAGHLEWRVSRLAAILEDFPEVNWRMVAGRCLDYIEEREGVQDGPRTLRTFMEREQREHDARLESTPPAAHDDHVFPCFVCRQPVSVNTELAKRKALGLPEVFSGHLECMREPENPTEEHHARIERQEAQHDPSPGRHRGEEDRGEGS